MQKIIIRSDDFDFRMSADEYLDNHRKFVDAGLVETAVIQFCQNSKMSNIPFDLAEKMIKDPTWDLQLHGWSHDSYGTMDFNSIIRDISAAIFWFKKVFKKKPTIWFPPRNENSTDMQKVASILGLKIDNESWDIGKFIRSVKDGTYDGHSVYYHLWNHDESPQIDEMINCIKEYANNG